MSALLESVLDDERRRDAQAHDDEARRFEAELARQVAPYWMFGPRTPEQERIEHPARASAKAVRW